MLHVIYTGKFENETTPKTGPIQFGQQSIPVDIAGTWSQMLVPSAVIVVCMDHSQMLTQFMHDTVDIATEAGMACI